LIAGLGWAVLSGLVLAGPYVYYHANSAIAYGKGLMAAIGALSGVITAILGKSSLTPAQGAARDWKGTASNIALAVAGPLFAIILVILLSVVLDWILVGYDQACFPLTATPFCSAGDEILVGYDQACILLTAVPACSAGHWSLIGLALAAVALVANFFVNVNRFSLHTLYRNRLIRDFLGGPREPDRKQDGFTGFDWDDNFRVASLWGGGAPTGRHWRPYHVINMTLNLASTSHLAWQQRKGESFIVSPKFCGSTDLGYRPTGEYGDPHGGITLGTAMAISGAAVSPNMGYHSSPSIAFLLTFFNVRLGWWLGNPGPAGSKLPRWQRVLKKLASGGEVLLAPYAQEAPWFAIRPLLAELFGLTTEKSPYVYLSDGGHFEDLALYEMVRRRCRWIIVCDGAEDRDRIYEDLGNAVRKIWIDLGVRIRFPESALLEATGETKPTDLGYFALGTIEYSSDGAADEPAPLGKILYIKPAVRGDEGAAEIIAYQRQNPDFPNQSTIDQWFNEPQLEAYRALGHYIMTRLVDALDGYPPTTLEEFFDRLSRFDLVTLAPRPRDHSPTAFVSLLP
jgi:hypothetical protein